ncbi:hypothetical protein DQ244_18915 [Blastococcus sp. TBT05-19]|uniref:hypothetical protein n=1 Tax=Blastococcus sp. TBT05-19 TaxID=2250581 RepID=UPI000DE8A8A8|nr:hypothetical protein [Blastococcus sp. TBT05-19]RBY86738.1 hypothetical protein DQ244_18915 [Blastococcus sp. TBT05-19]
MERGEALTLRFDDREVTVFWGPVGDVDRVAVRDGRVLTWSSPDDCVSDAARHAWRGLGDDDIGRSAMDFGPAQDWLRGRRPALPTESALNLWNTAKDVADSVDAPWRDRGPTADRCYRKLFAANVPWVFELEAYRPRWLAAELRCVRTVLGRAVHVLRSELG